MNCDPRIKIGNQTAFAADTPARPFEYALTNGFDAFEWFPDKKPWGAGWDESNLSPDRRREIRDLAQARGIRLSVHARWQANPLKPEARPILLKDLELARDFGAALLNIHLQTEQGLPAYVEAIAWLIGSVSDAGMQLAIENTPMNTPGQFNELFARLGEMASIPAGRVGMCLDLGHANLCAATRNDYVKYLDQLDRGVPIIHLHFHENWGDSDSHLPLFTGPAGQNDSGIRLLLERLRQRHYSGAIILEQWPQPPVLLNQAREHLLRLLGELPVPENGTEATAGVSKSGEAADDSGVRSSPAAAASIRLDASDDPTASPVLEIAAPEDGCTPQAKSPTDDALAIADKASRSWREKLASVFEFLAGEKAPAIEQLVDAAIYLRFLGTGAIPCAEDGRHFRPGHHAQLALQIQERLAKLTAADTFLVRQIYPWLPSSAQTFRRAEPLTRIRDIAHRNDIPQDLKREIKHSLQNKLHRCAGPEDLATSAALLERITRPGANFSSEFVEQFKLFHEELKEFFNARSLDERLGALRLQVDTEQAAVIQRFLEAKAGTTLPAQQDAFRLLTELRQEFLEAVARQPGAGTQELLLADIGLEDFAFVLLSELINALDTAAPAPPPWDALLDALLLTICNLALSGIEPEEGRAIEAELLAWEQDFDPADREHLLRLKATADRARRLAEDFCDRIMTLFPPRVEKLGRALGVADHAIRVFCDAEIRRHIVFQLSKLVSSLLRHIRETLALPAWDVLVSGEATGCLRVADSLDELEPLSEPAVVLLEDAEGDEEIPRHVTGLVLGREIPHLSHLGVRARQAGVAFATCEQETTLQKLRALQGQNIRLAATAESVRWETVAASVAHPNKSRSSKPVQLPEADLTPARVCVPPEEITSERGGGKAVGARKLAELAGRGEAGFQTPPALVVPFGVMEESLRAAPALDAEYQRLLKRFDSMTALDFAPARERLAELARSIHVPDALARAVAEAFSPDDRLMVRSSANGEDLAELSGAGLYESVANVAPAGVARAVSQVWASLWTRRAVVSRKQAGVPHRSAHMAVLIQKMIAPELSFVLHTVNPVNRNTREVYAEIAVGLGETLASAGVRGNPYRLVCDKESGAITTLAFASFSQALRPDPAGGVTRKTLDYSQIGMSRDATARQDLGRRLANIARRVEESFSLPQDIEGVVAGDLIYLVQSRPQQGLAGKEPG